MQPASPTPTFLGNKVKLPTQHDRKSLQFSEGNLSFG
jgi:hypothetical protein